MISVIVIAFLIYLAAISFYREEALQMEKEKVKHGSRKSLM
ncbi:MAG TPA: hypothetical protein VF181_02680 [Balneolaceae bacterium]